MKIIRKSELKRYIDSCVRREVRRHLVKRNDGPFSEKVVPAVKGLAIGGTIGSISGLILGKYVIPKLINKINISLIRKGKADEDEYVESFKKYFASGTSWIKRFVEPEIWSGKTKDEVREMTPKVMSARSARDLSRLFPNSKALRAFAEEFDKIK